VAITKTTRLSVKKDKEKVQDMIDVMLSKATEGKEYLR